MGIFDSWTIDTHDGLMHMTGVHQALNRTLKSFALLCFFTPSVLWWKKEKYEKTISSI
jgi:hypothetical protein